MDFRVPMRELEVVMALTDTEPAGFIIFLAPYSERRSGPETISDYLNGTRRFLPMVSDGLPRIVNRDQILWVKTVNGEDADEQTVLQKPTILELIDGRRVEGVVEIDRPSDRSRLSDLLNDSAETFIRLGDGPTTWFVNKRFIRVAVPR